MSWRCAHNMAVVFHTIHRGQRDTRLCNYLVKLVTLYLLLLSQIQGSYVLIPPTFSTSITPGPYPPHLPARSCYTFPLSPLRIRSASLLPVTVSSSETSLNARLLTWSKQCLVGSPWLCPTRRPSAWGLALPELCFWYNLEVGGGFPVEEGDPPDNPGPHRWTLKSA